MVIVKSCTVHAKDGGSDEFSISNDLTELYDGVANSHLHPQFTSIIIRYGGRREGGSSSSSTP